MLVRVGSRNPVKIAATREAVRAFFRPCRIVGSEGRGRVFSMPRSMGDIVRGARARARGAWAENGLGVGIEAGTFRLGGRRYLVTVACVTDGRTFTFGGGPFFEAVGKRDDRSGMVAEVTGGRVDRSEVTRAAVLMALSSFLLHVPSLPDTIAGA